LLLPYSVEFAWGFSLDYFSRAGAQFVCIYQRTVTRHDMSSPKFRPEFGYAPASPPDGADLEVRQVLSRILRSPSNRRGDIAVEMSRRIGRRVTVHMLNDYTRLTGVVARFPAAWVRVFCEVTGDDSLQMLLLSPRLLKLIEAGKHAEAAHRQIAGLIDDEKRRKGKAR
jgi:hypothetical protein